MINALWKDDRGQDIAEYAVMWLNPGSGDGIGQAGRFKCQQCVFFSSQFAPDSLAEAQ